MHFKMHGYRQTALVVLSIARIILKCNRNAWCFRKLISKRSLSFYFILFSAFPSFFFICANSSTVLNNTKNCLCEHQQVCFFLRLIPIYCYNLSFNDDCNYFFALFRLGLKIVFWLNHKQ